MNDKFITARKIETNRVLLIDWSNLSMRNLLALPFDPTDHEKFLNWRNMMLRSLKKILKEHEASRVIFCLDGFENWRKEYYPEYKANRKEAREASKIDFNAFFKVQNEFIEGLKSILTNCQFLKVHRAEADDLIGVITKKRPDWKITLISSDRDFYQLYKYPNFRQYDAIKGKFIEVIDPKNYLLEKVVLGDAGDNVPKLKRGVGPKTIAKILNSTEGLDEWLKIENLEKEFERNMVLISFDFIPDDIQCSIDKAVSEWHASKFNARGLMDFLIKNGCGGQVSEIGVFSNLFKQFDDLAEETDN